MTPIPSPAFDSRSRAPEDNPGAPPPPSMRFNWAMALAGTWIVLGGYLDAWAHSQIRALETFWTPWHAVLYGGMSAMTALVFGAILSNRRRRVPWRQTIPPGYGLSAVGVSLFPIGGLGDLLWHTAFGVEQGVDAILSPTHLTLALGVALAITGPLRAAWLATERARSEGPGALLPALVSATLLLSLFTLITQLNHPFVRPWGAQNYQPVAEQFPLAGPIENEVSFGGGVPAADLVKMIALGDVLLQTGFLMVLLFLLIGRFALPPGSVTFLLGVNALLLAVSRDQPFVVPVAVATGVTADLLLLVLRPGKLGAGGRALFGLTVPTILWSTYFLALWTNQGLWWPPSISAGYVASAALIGWLASAVLPMPPRHAPSAQPHGLPAPPNTSATYRFQASRATSPVLGLWLRLTEPSARLGRPEERRRARMLAGLMTVLVPLGVVSAGLVPFLTDPGYRFLATPVSRLGVLASLAMTVAYGLARTRWYAWGTLSAIVIAMGFTWVVAVFQAGTTGSYVPLVFLVVPVVLSAMLLELRHTALVALAAGAVALSTTALVPGVAYAAINVPFVFLVMVSALVLLFSAVRGRDLRQISEGAERLEDAQRLTHLGYWEWDLPRNEVTFSDELYRMLGLEPRAAAISFDAFLERIHPEDRVIVDDTMHGPMKTRGTFSFDHRVVRLDGTVRWIHMRGQVVKDDRGFATSVVGTSQDITERKEAEKARLAAYEQAREIGRLKELNEVKAQFLNTAAHELSTPLVPITIQLRLMKKGWGQEIPKVQQDALAMVDRNVQRLTRLMNDFLEASRLQVNRLGVEKRSIDLSRVVQEAVDSFRPAAQESGVRLHAVSAPHLSVAADPTRIRQVLDNLLTNALKFTPRGGEVTMEALRNDEEVQVAVHDTGIGLTPEQRAKLFQPFTQVHDPSEYRAGGTGLGLHISRGIMELHGGRIWAESPGSGLGSTFTLALPIHAPPGEVVTPPISSPRQSSEVEPAEAGSQRVPLKT